MIAGKPYWCTSSTTCGGLGTVEEIVYIHRAPQSRMSRSMSPGRTSPDIPSVFIEQKVQDWNGGARSPWRVSIVDQPVLDHLRRHDLRRGPVGHEDDPTADGIMWVKEVEDYQRFGVVVTDADGNMTKIVEKPSTPISKRANIGLYLVTNWKLLLRGHRLVLTQPKNKGEYYLTDAFQYMIDRARRSA
jgi:glucose-1-phosphate thymidylyltransferase